MIYRRLFRRPTQPDWFCQRPWIDAPDADIPEYCAKHTEPLFDLREKLTEWRRDGIVIFEKVVDLAAIDQFTRDLKWIIQNPKAFSIMLDVSGKMESIGDFTTAQLESMTHLKFYGLHGYSEAARELCLTAHVTSFLQHILGNRPAPMSTLTFLRGSQQPAHADFPFVFKQKSLPFMAASWVSLEDVHSDSGPLAYYPGSHRVENFGFYDFGKGQIILRDGDIVSPMKFADWLHQKIEEQEIPKKIFLPKRGDVLVWHAALVHEGLPIRDEKRTRMSLVTHYTSVEHMPENHIKRDENGTPVFFEKGAGVIFQYPWVDYSQQVPQGAK